MPDEGPDPSAWLVTFGDLITLLLTFFVLLLSMSSMSEERVKKSFAYFADKPFLLEGGETVSLGPRKTAAPTSSVERIKLGMQIASEIEGILVPQPEQKKTGLKERILDAEGEVSLRADERGQTITFSGSFLFLPGSAIIETAGIPILDKIAKIIARSKEKVSVEGHTDDVEEPADPRFRDRWELSAARAVNVLKYLIQKGKINPSRMSASGYAGSRPRVPYRSKGKNGKPVSKAERDRARDKNRRVDIVILGK